MKTLLPFDCDVYTIENMLPVDCDVYTSEKPVT